MEMSVLQRINEVMSESGLKKSNLAKAIEMDSTTVGRQLRGDQALSAKLIEGFLVAFPDVSAEWLLRGSGKCYLSTPYFSVSNNGDANSDSTWKAKYEELEKRYDQLLTILGGGMSQRKVNVG